MFYKSYMPMKEVAHEKKIFDMNYKYKLIF